jgi:hypothetical protein
MYDMSPALYPAHLVPGCEELAGAVLKAQVLAVHHPQGLDARQHQVLRHLENIHKIINPEAANLFETKRPYNNAHCCRTCY